MINIEKNMRYLGKKYLNHDDFVYISKLIDYYAKNHTGSKEVLRYLTMKKTKDFNTDDKNIVKDIAYYSGIF